MRFLSINVSRYIETYLIDVLVALLSLFCYYAYPFAFRPVLQPDLFCDLTLYNMICFY